MDDTYLSLHSEYKDNMESFTDGRAYYAEMADAIERGNNKFSLFNRYFDKKIDLNWVEEIEACIIPLDNIIRVPRKFIVQEEEIVPIERARKITNESIRHLAQHTNMIAKVEGDDVTPNQILNVFREESFEVYENRFVFTLMQNLVRFIDVRYDVLFNISDDENMASLKMDSAFKHGREQVTYKLEVSTQSSAGELEGEAGPEGENATAFQRIERVKRIINEYYHSSFMKELRNCVPVRPPIMRTNAIQKNPNFRACLKLWQFIQSYRDIGYEITARESNDMVSDEYRKELYDIAATNFMLLKHNTVSEDMVGKQKTRKLKPKILKRLAEELVLDYDMEEVEIRRVFVDELKRASKKKITGEVKITEAIDRALASEDARKKAIEERIKAKIAHQKEMERRRIEREKARIAKQKALEKAKKEKAKALAKAKKEKELALAKEKAKKEKERARLAKLRAIEKEKLAKQKEQARLAKEKERAEKLKALEEAKIAKEKQREKDRIAKEKALQAEKERKAKELAKEKERIAKEKALQAEKERKAKELAKEKERIAKEKALQAEKERKAKELAKEKERIAKEKALQAEKERKAKELAKEKERIAKEKALQAEKERKAKELAKEKERIAKEKALQAEKERAEKAKAKEKERLDKEKAARLEKERKAKELAKEKERAAKAKAAEADKLRIKKAKEREMAKIAKEKAIRLEKERIAKEKAKEKDRLLRAKALEAEKLRIEKAKAKEKERIAKQRAAKLKK